MSWSLGAQIPKPRRGLVAGWLAIAGLLCGCQKDSPPVPAQGDKQPAAARLKIQVADDPGIAAALRRWQREWEGLSGGSFEVTEVAAADLPADAPPAADVLIFPSDLFGQLVERQAIVPLRANQFEGDKFAASKIFPLVWDREVRWGQDRYAVPLGSPVLTLCYRADRLEKLGLKPPATWKEYAEITQRLSANPPDGKRKDVNDAHGNVACEPLAAGWAGRVFLARAAAYARHRNQFSTLFDSESMQPLIASPPFVRALEELVAASGGQNLQRDPAECLQALLNGHCALALSWPSAASGSSGEKPAATAEVSFAELPGGDAAYNAGTQQWEPLSGDAARHVTLLGIAGRLAAVSRASKNVPTAMRLLAWISGPEMSSQISPKSPATTLFRKDQAERPAAWTNPGITSEAAQQYAASVESALSRAAHVSIPTFAGAPRYLSALDDAVRRAAQGEASPADALKSAAAAWEKITAELGRAAQRAAYLRSLGESP